eukprot:TRINITY_DN10538_c0_g1_i1.p1 TRINITY_DN10538_c0_g1~~TRINITY_DN10538_c0_g1_i1.p1  ORF type:complete len:132 (+),score=11.77 TRINITY_DN10538_c0_g1_i1:63-458(+)
MDKAAASPSFKSRSLSQRFSESCPDLSLSGLADTRGRDLALPIPKCYQSHKAMSRFFRTNTDNFSLHCNEKYFPAEQRNNSVRAMMYSRRQFLGDRGLAGTRLPDLASGDQMRMSYVYAGAPLETIFKDCR